MQYLKPKHTFKAVTKWLKDDKVKHCSDIAKTRSKSHRVFGLKQKSMSQEGKNKNPTPVTPVISGGISKYYKKHVEGQERPPYTNKVLTFDA